MFNLNIDITKIFEYLMNPPSTLSKAVLKIKSKLELRLRVRLRLKALAPLLVEEAT